MGDGGVLPSRVAGSWVLVARFKITTEPSLGDGPVWLVAASFQRIASPGVLFLFISVLKDLFICGGVEGQREGISSGLPLAPRSEDVV